MGPGLSAHESWPAHGGFMEGAWRPRWAHLHALAFAVVCAGAGSLGLVIDAPSVPVQLAVLVPAVLVLGIPHGAFDGALVLEAFAGRGGARRGLYVLLAYLGLSGLVVLGWWQAPGASLVAFLAVSVFHFALCERDAVPGRGGLAALEAAARGGAPVLLPVLFHTESTSRLFALLVPGLSAAELAGGLGSAAPWIATAFLVPYAVVAARRLRGALRGGTGDGVAALELVAVLLAGISLPPLLFFAICFCLGHAPRHTIEIAAAREPGNASRAMKAFVRGAAPFTLATWALFAAGASTLSAGALDSTVAIRLTFVGLAALTLPHLLLQLSLRRDSGAASRSSSRRPVRPAPRPA